MLEIKQKIVGNQTFLQFLMHVAVLIGTQML
jgi:hypothetical protein